MNTETNTGKRGRTKGSVSFATVSVEQLTGLPANTLVPISRRFAEMLNLKATAMVASTKALKALTQPASVTVTQPEAPVETPQA